MSPIRRPRRLAFAMLALAFGTTVRGTRVAAGDVPPPAPAPPSSPPAPKGKPPPPPPLPPIPTVVHVPTDELDVLLRGQGRGVILRYDEYRALLEAARGKDGAPEAPPQDVVRLSGDGTLDLTDERAARFEIVYRVQSLAPGPRSVGFDSGGVAFESIRVEPEGAAGPGRYEARDGAGRVYLDGPGVRRVTVAGSAVPTVDGATRRLDLWLPNPAAMALAVTVPPGVEATLEGEGAPLSVASPAERPVVVWTRPTRGGHLGIAWTPSAKGTEGPAVLDADVRSLYTVADGVVAVRSVARVDLLRTPTDTVVLEVPKDLAVHAVEGGGVTGFSRTDDRTRVRVRLEQAVLGRVEVLVQGERPFVPGRGIELPRVRVAGALRHRGEAALRFGPDVNARAVRVEGGRRVPMAGADPQTAGVLRYALARADAGLTIDVEPGALRVDASGTYYLSLAEPGQTLFAIVTYRVVEGTLHRLSPRFPREFDLRELTLDGVTTGFARDTTADGRVEITLGKGVSVGGELRLLATLERARADWVPEKERVAVPFVVPAAGATREEAYVAVGADPGFEVLDAGGKDLVAVGAADLAARGLSSTGLVYGYRVDGPAPVVTLDVSRREPLVEADVVTVLHPGPRRVDLSARAVYRIQRAGVRRLALDLPSWAGDQVDVQAPSLRAATRLLGERRPADVPAGYDRWQIDLEQRALGTFVVTASWFLDRDADDWTIEADRRLVARAPLERAERLLVVRRSAGLEVSLPQLAGAPDVRILDVAEAPVEAGIDALGVLEVLRLPAGRDGVAIAVRKHGGAAVLGAIATEVSLRTAVAREGILRTRAEMTLFNIDRQFVEVRLPARSTLVGAVVGGIPVKPLVSPTGALLLTVPATLPTAQARAPRVRVALTYETRLAGEVGGAVRVEAPRFPGLEVLHTTHEVAVEPDQVITGVGGDLLATGRVASPGRVPWLLAAISALSPTKCGGAASAPSAAETIVVGSGAARRGSETRTYDQAAGRADPRLGEIDPGSTPTPEETEQVHPVDVVPRSRAPEPSTPGLLPEPPPAGAPPGLRTPTPMTLPPPAFPPPPAPPSTPSGPSDDPHHDHDLPGDRSGPGEGKPGVPQGGDASAGKGGPGSPDDARRGGPAGRARKGQLSLDVPVFLAPNRVIASRVGGGGAMELDLGSKGGRERTYLLLGLLAFAIALGVIALGWLSAWWTVLAGLLVALVLAVSFGASASSLVAAVADAATALGVLLSLRWLVAWAFGARPQRGIPPAPKAPPRAPPGAPPAAAAVLCLLVAGAFAAPAHAGDGPAPAPAPAAGTVIAPHDPAKGADLATDDRVFLPLSVWLELERKAHPERDPEVVALGRVVTLVEASYRLDVGATNAQGSARLVFAQRGGGTQLVPVPLAGLAIVEARLDGQPVHLLLDGGTYRVALDREGDHALDLRFQTPVVTTPAGRAFAFRVPTFAGSTLDVTAGAFDGELRVSGAGRVLVRTRAGPASVFSARAHLGRPTGTGPVQPVTGLLAETRPEALQASVRTRAESRIVHSLRDGGTESVLGLTLHVLQGKAAFVDLSLTEGVEVLEATGPEVARWETGDGRLRLVFGRPMEGKVGALVRTFRPADAPERREVLPELAVRDTTGEGGLVVVNGDASLRLEADAGPTLFRTGRPADGDAAGPDGQGRVLGAWRFASRPAPLAVRTERAQARLEIDTRVRVTFGDERVRSVIESRARVLRAPVGELAFALPGVDEVRSVEAPGLETWWLDGQGEARRLLVRFADLFEGDRAVTIRLERRLGSVHEGIAAPRIGLEGAQADRGLLVLFALPDVEPSPGAAADLKALPPTRLEGHEPNVAGGRATHAFSWDAPVGAALPVALRTPDQEIEAVVVSQISPSDEAQRLEHLVVFDVRRGATDRLNVFVPDGGLAASDVVRARDLRELRSEPAVRTDADGKPVKGRLYALRLQSSKSGVVEVTISQRWPAASVIPVVRPEGAKATRWFGLLRTFLDGEVEARVTAGAPDPVDWTDLPFLPTGLERASVLRTYAARAPYLVEVTARRHRIEVQADAVVLSTRAEVVVGLDGEARVRVRYRLFNRARQFLPLRLPEGATLYGAVAAGVPVKPLAGPEGDVLLPVPKVPLGGAGYEVSIAYRARVGDRLEHGGNGTLLLPQVVGVEVDRTVISLRVPSGYAYTFDTKMTEASEREAVGDVVEASLREAQEVLKVAQSGTLDQRQLACSTTTPLVEQARTRLLDYERRGASRARVALLRSELDKLTQVQREALARCETDATVARNEEQFEANNEQAANANGQTLLRFRGPEGAVDGRGALQTTEEAGANWGFNGGRPGDVGGGKNKEYVELKQRLQGALEQRDEGERRKFVQERVPQAEAGSGGGGGGASRDALRQAADDEIRGFDQTRNNELLNDRLKKAESSRLAGAVADGADVARAPSGARPGRPGVDLPAGRASRWRAALPGEESGDGAAAAARVGLMGVDVPLPTDGVVFWFVGARAGAAVTFDASPEGTSPWLRALLALGLFTALGVGLVQVSRRRR